MSEYLGLHPVAFKIYRKVRLSALTIEYLVSSEELTVSVGGVSVLIGIQNRGEYNRVTVDFPNERECLGQLISELDNNDAIWDIGANIGVHSCLMAASLAEGSVTAFEPLPENSDRIKENVERNNLHNVSVEELALSNESGESSLSVGTVASGVGNASLVESARNKSVTVETIQGDSIIERDVPKPDVLKIDVEGAELKVLDGLSDTLADKQVRIILCEVHTGYEGISVSSIKSKLEQHGYRVEQVSSENDGQPFVWAHRE